MRRARPLLLLCSLLGAGAALGHEVRHTVATGTAVVVTLSYADGKPFAYEKYELTPEGATVPAQVGNSDAQGRVVFVPGATANWRLKAFTADGHGADLRIAVPAQASEPSARPTAAPPAHSSGDGPSRASLVLFGLGLILAGFGLLQLFISRKKT